MTKMRLDALERQGGRTADRVKTLDDRVKTLDRSVGALNRELAELRSLLSDHAAALGERDRPATTMTGATRAA